MTRNAAPSDNPVPPSPAPDDTPDLATRQAALVRALVADGPTPPGFTPADLEPTATALLRKRAGLVAKRYPLLAQQTGPDFPDRFTTWARGRPATSVADDAASFAAASGLAPRARRRWFRR